MSISNHLTKIEEFSDCISYYNIMLWDYVMGLKNFQKTRFKIFKIKQKMFKGLTQNSVGLISAKLSLKYIISS